MRTTLACVAWLTLTLTAHADVFEVEDGHTLILSDPSQITGTNNLTKNGLGTLQIAGASNYSGKVVLNGGELRVEGDQPVVDAFLNSRRLQELSGEGGMITFAYGGTNQQYRIIDDQPKDPGLIKLGFDSVNRDDHAYGLGETADRLRNYAGIVIRGGQVFMQSNQSFLGDGVTPTTLELTGGYLQLFGGPAPSTLTFSGKVTMSGGYLDGGGFGGAKGTLATSGDVELNAGTTITAFPNLISMPGEGSTNRLTGSALNFRVHDFTKEGAGTTVIESEFGTERLFYVKQGTLQLGSGNRISSTSDLRLAGTFATGGYSDTLGLLEVRGNAHIDFGHGDSSILIFTDSSAITWVSRLTILNWSGNLDGNGTGIDQLYFGKTSRGLLAGQVARITFVDPANLSPGTYGARITESGEILPYLPRIESTLNGKTLILKWPVGYILQSAPKLEATAWTDLATSSPYTITIGSGTMFFRLIKR